jgi:hypothetical protein
MLQSLGQHKMGFAPMECHQNPNISLDVSNLR